MSARGKTRRRMTPRERKVARVLGQAHVLESRHSVASDGRHVTYQLEWVLCGKPHCGKKHGPYWYAYFRPRGVYGGATRKVYIGKDFQTVDDKAREKERAKPKEPSKKRREVAHVEAHRVFRSRTGRATARRRVNP